MLQTTPLSGGFFIIKMKTLHIIHLGIGNVGKTVVKQIIQNEKRVAKEFGVKFSYYGLFTSKKQHLDTKGFSPEKLHTILSSFETNVQENNNGELDAIRNVPLPFVVIDTTASEETYPLLLAALKRGGFVVLSNKRPLANGQKNFDALHTFGNRLFYETTVGSALPVIKTIKNLLENGDEIIEIKACLSGSLGFILTELEHNVPFSKAIEEAKKRGYTEPDPRDDLSGADVVRKTVILSRMLGRKLDASDVVQEVLYPHSLNTLSLKDFFQAIKKYNASYEKKFERAKKQHKTLRFVATITPKKSSVKLETVAHRSNLGILYGPDNLIQITSKRFLQNPLVIKGPGAGAEVTASGVVTDLLAIAKTV